MHSMSFCRRWAPPEGQTWRRWSGRTSPARCGVDFLSLAGGLQAAFLTIGTRGRGRFAKALAVVWQVRKVMEKVKKHQGCPDAHIAHQLSWETMEQEVLKFVRAGDTEGLKAFVQKFTEKSNSLLEVGLTARNSSEIPLKDVRV